MYENIIVPLHSEITNNMFHFKNHTVMAKNISEYIKSSKVSFDFTTEYKKLFTNNCNGNKTIYGLVNMGTYTEVGKLAVNVENEHEGINAIWSDAEITKEQEEWKTLNFYAMMIVTDKDGAILHETPKRYF